MSYTKIKIAGTIELKTGLHIGGDDSFSAIGAIDSPVVRDPLTREPVIPGSSLKGVNGFNNDCAEITRLFGSSSDTSNAAGTGIQMSRLQFSDCFLVNKESLPQVFENKFENTIDRLTSVANPRQIERVVRGARFAFEIIYNVEDELQIEEDFANINTAIRLLQHDYLGGGGTRGSGRVVFEDLSAVVVTGNKGIAVPKLG